MDIAKLKGERDAARTDKEDLFMFYHNNWDKLVAYAELMETELANLDEMLGDLPCDPREE